MRICTLIVSFYILPLFGFAQSKYFPDSIWQLKRPEELGLKKDLIDSAVRIALANENKYDRDLRLAILKSYANEPDYKIIGPTKHRGGPAGLIIKNGYIVAQWGDVQRVDMTFSVTKSYLSTIAGLAVDQKLIRKLDDKVGYYVPESLFDTPHNSKITWSHLLTQTSDWSGTLFGLHDWADRPPKEGSIDDWKARKLNEPGTVFKYNDVRVNLLAYSLLHVWRKPLPQVLKEKVMDPIGASTTWRWHGYDNSFVTLDGLQMQSVSGGGHHGGGIFINTFDQARFGLLFLRNGKWNTKQLVSEQWVKAVQQQGSVNKDYGYMWWNNSSGKWPGVSKNLYYALGAGGNYIIIDEANDLLVVTRWLDDAQAGNLMKLITDALAK